MDNKKRNNGSIHEGRSIEIGGLMQQDTEGKIEFIRKKITNAPDGGIDSEKMIDSELDYKQYITQLKEECIDEKRQWGLQKSGVSKDLARLTAYCGDRYYWVVQKHVWLGQSPKLYLLRQGL